MAVLGWQPSVLIVEDDALVAMEMEARVTALGCAVIGPAGTLREAEALIDETRPDAALLDVNIHGLRVTPIAERLKAEGIPYALVTGYARLPFDEPALKAAPKLSKPVSDTELARALERMLVSPRRGDAENSPDQKPSPAAPAPGGRR